MTKANKPSRFRPVEIGKVDGIRTVVEAVPQEMTAFGGIPMLARMEKKIGLIKELSRRVIDSRKQHLVEHAMEDILLQRTFQVGVGFADGNDSTLLRGDPAMLLGLERDPVNGRSGASKETMSRTESKAVNEKNLDCVNALFIDHFLAQQRKRPKRVLELDFDGSMIKTFGAQEGSVYRGGKYQSTMYFPLMAFCGDWLLGTILRRGDKAEAKTILKELKKIVKKIRDKWPAMKIKVRMDSAFCSGELVKWLKEQKISYQLALRTTSVLRLCSKAFEEEAELLFRNRFEEPRFIGKDADKAIQKEHARIRGLSTDERMKAEHEWKNRRTRVVGSFCYKPEKWREFLAWNEWQRVICRCDYTDKGLEVKYVLVSQHSGNPQKMYEKEYCNRGMAEQCVGLFKQIAKRLSAQEYFSNQFRLILYGAAYMLMMHLHNFVCKKLKRADMNTLRKNLMIMPMLIRRTEKKIVLQISESHAHRFEYLDAWRRLTAA